MKKLTLFLLLAVFQLSNVTAQIKTSDKVLLGRLLTKKINNLRRQKNKIPLKRNIDLAKAAKLHVKYMVKHNKLSHQEDNVLYKNPSDRVAHFNKSFISIGENVLFTKPVQLPLNKKSLHALATNMFLAWKNSPGHYANMISEAFTLGDFGFKYNTRTRRIFAAHVFGKKGTLIAEQISDNAFGIKKGTKNCKSHIKGTSNLITNMGNNIYITEGEIFIRHHSKKTLQKVIKETHDGVAIDLVSREQLSCKHENKLDKSPIHDGIMLKPIYRDKLFQNNIAQSNYRFIASLGKVPEHLREEKFSPNLIILKNGKKCAYAVPSYIPHKRYELMPIEPLIITPKITLKTKGVNNIKQLFFDFKSRKTIATNHPEINSTAQNIYSIDIKSFTSVDGNSKENYRLQNQRAKYIQNYIATKVNLSNIKVNIEAKENWELFDYQLLLLGKDSLVKLDNETKKEYLHLNVKKQWKENLSLQRKSNATLFQYGTWKKDENYAYHNLVDALITNNNPLANKALAELYKQKYNSIILDQDFILERLIKRKELVQNTTALIIKNIDYYAIDKIVFYVSNWLSKPEVLSKDAQKNLLNLYAITTRKLLKDWDTNYENLSKIIHPEKVTKLMEHYKSDTVTPLYLNFHMSSIEYYGQINYSPMINYSFEYIINYFKNKAMTIEDDIALCLFFNSWSRYDLTIELLKNSYLYKELNEDAHFIFLHTLVAYKEGLGTNKKNLKYLHEQAIEFNKERWCNWTDTNFQNLRSNDVKKLYCKTCNLK